MGFEFSLYPEHCEGGKGELVDYCLLRWRSNRENLSYSDIWRRALKKIVSQQPEETYSDWLEWRLAQVGCVDEKEWITHVMKSTSPELLKQAIPVALSILPKKAGMNLIANVVANNNLRLDARAKAIHAFDRYAGKESLLKLVDAVNEDIAWEKFERNKYYAFMDESHLLYDYISVYPMLRFLRKEIEKSCENGDGSGKTLSDEAEKKLKEITGKDFGKDTQAWRKWIENNKQ